MGAERSLARLWCKSRGVALFSVRALHKSAEICSKTWYNEECHKVLDNIQLTCRIDVISPLLQLQSTMITIDDFCNRV